MDETMSLAATIVIDGADLDDLRDEIEPLTVHRLTIRVHADGEVTFSTSSARKRSRGRSIR